MSSSASDSNRAVHSQHTGTAGRLHCLDHLRAVVVVLVIVLHASMTYMAFPPEWWYVIEPKNSRVFTLLVLGLDVPSMQILFFIAGFFAYPSIQRHGPARFLRQKLVRLGLPWLVGVVFLAPPMAYLITLTRGIAKPYLEFWLTDFWGPYFQQSVYWFLGILLALFALLTAFVNSEARWQFLERQPTRPTWVLFVRFWAATTLWFLVCSMVAPADTWINSLKLLTFQPARLGLYLGYFGLGLYADRAGWLRENGYQPTPSRWLLFALASGSAYLALRFTWPGGDDLSGLLLQAALFNGFCLSGLMAGLALFQRFFDRPSRFSSSLARNAFAIYYVHPLILYPAAYGALSVNISIYLEATLLILFTTFVAWAVAARVLTRWPLLREIF